MSLISIVLLALALAADSFAASVARGANLARPTIHQAFLVGSVFALVQVLMPIAGWRVGVNFQPLVQSFDHWIAFGILSAIGGKMTLDGLRQGGASTGSSSFTLPALILTAIATSIDALVVGFGFGVLNISVLLILIAIGCVTFLTALGGLYLGNHLGARVGKFVEVAAGLILIGIGIRILLTHVVS